MRIKNSKGSVFYGMHFYPGVAEYQDPKTGPYRVFINEDTIRKMNSSFTGRPVFVDHVDNVPANKEHMRAQADGYVIDSFYNKEDGKHWAKFIIITERGEQAIRQGYRLSNCYMPTQFGPGGVWNGVQFKKEVKGGEYEHLALVDNPRYDESIVMTPEQFKAYNAGKAVEIQRLANSKSGKDSKVKVIKPMFFKREKIANADTFGETSVLLPKSKREVTINALVMQADEAATVGAEGATIDVDGEMMTVAELVAAYKALKEQAEQTAEEHEDEDGDEDDLFENEDEADEDAHDSEAVENEDDEDDEDDDSVENEGKPVVKTVAAKKPAAKVVAKKPVANKVKMKVKKTRNEADDDFESGVEDSDAVLRANRLVNARAKPDTEKPQVIANAVALGKAKYGSGA